MQNWKNTFKKKLSRFSKPSLRDIILVSLSLFLVIMLLRKETVEVNIILPEATEMEKLNKPSLINHIYIGKQKSFEWGNTTRIQINDAFITINNLQDAVLHLDKSRPDYLLPKVTTSLKIDKAAKMGIVNEVKHELRKANELRVNYAAQPRF